MSTTLLAAEIELSKQLGDYWASTTTSAGAAGGTTLVDTALIAKANDWITDEAYDFIASEPAAAGVQLYEERKISSLSNTAGTLTVLAHSGQIDNDTTHVDYRIHRLFTASDKRIALVNAAKATFPRLFKEIRDETLVSHNWLKDGSLEIWTTSSNLTYWNESTVVATKTTSSPYYKHGATSCKLSTPAGYLEQSLDQWDDLKLLAGKAVTFTVQGWCDTASCLRLAIYDGITTTYSDYHDGDSAWTDEPLTVSATIDDNPTDISFKIYHAVAAGTSYVDDARVISSYSPRQYIGGIGLFRNNPHRILIEWSDYNTEAPWITIRGYDIDRNNSYLVLPSSVERDYRLRIEGIGYLDFLDSSGVSGTDWDDTISISEPQLQILVAQAAVYLYRTMIMPNFTAGDNQTFSNALQFWQNELRDRKARFGMEAPPATIHFASSR